MLSVSRNRNPIGTPENLKSFPPQRVRDFYAPLRTKDGRQLYPGLAPDWYRLDPNRPAVTLSRLAQVSGAGSENF